MMVFSFRETAIVIACISAFVLILLFEARSFVRLLRGTSGVFVSARVRLLRRAFHVLFAVGCVCFAYGYWIEPYRLQVRYVKVSTPKLRSSSLRIVHLSDLHLDETARAEEKLVSAVNALHPDLIVFTGDALNTHAALPRFRRLMARLQASLGKFAVRGNWDEWVVAVPDLYAGTGFTLLENESVVLRKGEDSCVILGVGLKYYPHARRLLQDSPRDPARVFLFHTPDVFEMLGDEPADLCLAGHTHGGQVALPWYGALITCSLYGKRYEAGRYQKNGSVLYVNRGIGMEGGIVPRVRFLCPPEVVCIDLIPSS